MSRDAKSSRVDWRHANNTAQRGYESTMQTLQVHSMHSRWNFNAGVTWVKPADPLEWRDSIWPRKYVCSWQNAINMLICMWNTQESFLMLTIVAQMLCISRGLQMSTRPPPQILSCCKILSTRLLALPCRKMCFFCLYSRTFIVSPAMRPALPPQNSSQIYAYGCKVSYL